MGSSCFSRWLLLGMLFLTVVGAYHWASYDNAFVDEDHLMIVRDRAVASWGDLIRVFTQADHTGMPYYRAVTRSTLLVQKAIHAGNPRPYHLFNTSLIGLMFLATFALLRRPGMQLTFWSAAIVAAIFVVHPVASSCVYPIASGRETLLPALFIVLSLWAYLRERWSSFALAAGLFVIALLGKEQAIVLPVIFLLADMLRITDRPRSWRSCLIRYAILALIVLLYLLLRRWIFSSQGVEVALWYQPQNLIWSLLYSLQSIIAPTYQLLYEPTTATWFDASRITLAAIVVLALGGMVWRDRATVGRVALFWLGWFVLTQVLTLNIFKQASPFTERYVFLAMLSVPALAAVVCVRSSSIYFRRTAGVVGILIVVGFMGISAHRGGYFRNNGSLAAQWVRTTPSAPAHYMLARWHMDQQQPQLAIKEFHTTLSLDPRHYLAHQSLGYIHHANGQHETAANHFMHAIRIAPDRADLYESLGDVQIAMDRNEQAEHSYREALRLNDRAVNARINLGALIVQRRDPAEGLRHLDAAIAISPDDIVARFNRGQAYELLQRFSDAASDYRHIALLGTQSPDLLMHSGEALWRVGHATNALKCLENAGNLRPDRARLPALRAWVLATDRDPSVRDGRRAVELAQQAIHLAGTQDAALVDVLAAAHAEAGDFDAAVHIQQQAVDLASQRWPAHATAPLRARLAMYQQGQAFRQPPSVEQGVIDFGVTMHE